MRCSVTASSQADSATLQNLCSTAASLGMLNRTRHFELHIHVWVWVYTYVLVTVFTNCQQEVQICPISAAPLRYFDKLNLLVHSCASVTPRCDLTRCLNIHKKPTGWSFVIRELFYYSLLRTFQSTTKIDVSHQLSCSSVLCTFWSICRTSWQYLASEFTTLLAGLYLCKCGNCKHRSQHTICIPVHAIVKLCIHPP